MKQFIEKHKENLKFTKCGSFTIINYHKNKINSLNINEYGLFRSVVVKDDKIVCVSPGKSYELTYFLKNNENYTIEEFIEGLMINCFFYNNKWHFATHSEINNVRVTSLFNSIFDSKNWKLMNEKYTYSFILQDPSLNLVIQKQRIYLIDIFDHENIINKHDPLHDVHYPEQYTTSWRDLVKDKCHLNSNCYFKGLVLKNNNKRAKIRNSAFEYYKFIYQNDTLIKIFDYFYLIKTDFINKYNIQLYNNIKKNYFELTFNIYIMYRNIYIRKHNIKLNDENIINILNELHYEYINYLKPKKMYITKKYVINKINSYDNYKRFKLVTNISKFHKLLGKLRI